MKSNLILFILHVGILVFEAMVLAYSLLTGPWWVSVIAGVFTAFEALVVIAFYMYAKGK